MGTSPVFNLPARTETLAYKGIRYDKVDYVSFILSFLSQSLYTVLLWESWRVMGGRAGITTEFHDKITFPV